VYSRVSTDAQERDGTSLDTQERACVEYAESQGMLVVECIRDTASGFTLDRPGMEQIRQLLRQGVVNVVVCYAVDRLSRNQNHIGVLFDAAEQADVRLEFVTEKFEDTAIGRFILAARAFIGEVEREKIAERTMRGKLERARSGRLPQGTGKGCYGYIYEKETGRRSIALEQAKVVKRIFNEFLGGMPIVKLANQLNGEGCTTLTGSKWHPATIHRMLRNDTYAGCSIFGRTTKIKLPGIRNGRTRWSRRTRDSSEWIEVEGASPQIVHPEVFESVQTILNDPERRRQGRKVYEYGLSGRVKCIKCGKSMVGQTLQKRFRYYRCRRAFAGPRHDRCPTVYLRADSLELAVKIEAAKVLANPELILVEADRVNSHGGHQAEAA
ncbi:MAG: recombinase family protein, partial [Dehalococcoidia bacterium]|nr:recombinase family protein [Dehalococcoidia bacterium]